jgi:HK97 family phage major capsid protein
MGAERVEVNATGEVLFPRWSGGTGGWLAESEAAVSDAAEIASVSATPHCAAARLGMSRRLRNQAREDVEAAVLRELGQCVAATLEAGFLTGTGTNEQPLGLINTPGIGSQSFADVPTLAERLKTVGYSTHQITANIATTEIFGLERGFDEVVRMWMEVPPRHQRLQRALTWRARVWP